MDSNYNTVVIIGAGFTGITTAIKLGELSPAPDYRIYEQSGEIGGTWHANTCK
jgi:cation diffusion facilitator CzcD-associated flavoprotein CzcO